jgi:C-terminal processing protease CtpA/Prc
LSPSEASEDYVLVSHRTPSASEGLSCQLEHFERAVVVGQRAAGAAHSYEVFPLGEFQVAIPKRRPVSPITGSNWEVSGVEPDWEVPAEDALEVAHRLALEALLARASDQAAKVRLEVALRTLTASSREP